MIRFCRIIAVGLILLLVAAACGGDATATPITQPIATSTVEPTGLPVVTDTTVAAETRAPADSPTPTDTSTPTETTAALAAMVASSQEGNLGPNLVDGDGMTLYLYTRDQRNVSNCTGGCAGAWPPLITEGEPTSGEGLDEARFSTITREDGSRQVTYNGWPLYLFSGDQVAGDANGQDSGGVWFTVSTNGGPIQTNAAVNVGEGETLGPILVDASGRTLYLFTNDEPSVSNCSGGCARSWPPLVTVDDPAAGDGVDGGLLGTVTREDGSAQVTYNGRPVYYYANDEKPGDTNGHDVGGVWFAVSISGESADQAGAAGGQAAGDDY
ncbi:MAG: hypothetical protein IIC97_02880 [Chloroflexi bacterium]|nr:hypothetical protein [Chloroflexota bacterium]